MTEYNVRQLRQTADAKALVNESIREFARRQDALFANDVLRRSTERTSRVVDDDDAHTTPGGVMIAKHTLDAHQRATRFRHAQLMICGANSSGKTTFVHYLLRCGFVLPSGPGSVTGRVVRLTFAPASEARACVYADVESMMNRSPPLAAIMRVVPEWIRERCRSRPASHPDSGYEQPPLKLAQRARTGELFDYDVKDIERTVGNLDLSHLFVGKSAMSVNWKDVQRAVRPLLERPNGVAPDSLQFEVWAMHVVELALPLQLLESGLDIYDTPGFLAGDPPILGACVSHFAHVLRPTVCFLYRNASFDEGTASAFEQLSQAVGSFRETGIFFLNTEPSINIFKNDYSSLPPWMELDDNEALALVVRGREDRYRNLLERVRTSSLPEDAFPVDAKQCRCWDMCNPVADPKSHKLINQPALDRLLQFVVWQELRRVRDGMQVVRRGTQNFFDYMVGNLTFTSDQLDHIRTSALKALEECQQECSAQNEVLQETISEAVVRMQDRLREKRNMILERAQKTKTPGDGRLRVMNEYQAEEIIRGAVISMTKDEVNTELNALLKHFASFVDQALRSKCAFANLLLRNAFEEVFMTRAIEDTSMSWAVRMALSIFNMVVFAPITLPWMGCRALYERLTNARIDESWKRSIAEKALDMVGSSLKKDGVTKIIQEWGEKVSTLFQSMEEIVRNHADVLERRTEDGQAVRACALQFYDDFARIEMKLSAMGCFMYEFNGATPEIGDTVIGSGADDGASDTAEYLFELRRGRWGPNESVAFKMCREPSAAVSNTLAIAEAHYHRTLIRCNIPHVMQPVWYHDGATFSVVFPCFPRTLKEHLSAANTIPPCRC